MTAADRAFVEALRADDTSGATAIVRRTVAWLAAEDRDPGARRELALACAAAQPAMAGLVTIRRIVDGEADPLPALAQLGERLRRAPAAIARQVVDILRLGLAGGGGRPSLTVVTCSASGVVEATLGALGRDTHLLVRCAESRPRGEGRSLAVRLASAGLDVELFTDAGISSAVAGSDALLLGADAVGPEAIVNKVGSAALCALASASGVPVYVLAGREKVLNASEFERLSFPDWPWAGEESRERLAFRNPLFERVPRQFVTAIFTDAGPLS